MKHVPILALSNSVSNTSSLAGAEGNKAAKTNNNMYEFLQGGIPEGKSLVYYIKPGVEGEFFGMQTAFHTLKNRRTCIFIASSKYPEIIRNEFRKFGWNVDQFKDIFFFVDAYSPLIGIPSKERYVISKPDNIDELSKGIKNLLKESPASTIVFGSLSTIMDLCGEKETIDAVKTWNNMAALYGHKLVYNFTAWPYSQDILDSIKKELFNAVICIGGMRDTVLFGRYCGILKSDWINKIGNPCLSVFSEP